MSVTLSILSFNLFSSSVIFSSWSYFSSDWIFYNYYYIESGAPGEQGEPGEPGPKSEPNDFLVEDKRAANGFGFPPVFPFKMFAKLFWGPDWDDNKFCLLLFLTSKAISCCSDFLDNYL